MPKARVIDESKLQHNNSKLEEGDKEFDEDAYQSD
jgi:hypothetical protein